MQTNQGNSITLFERRMFHFVIKLVVFVIVCSLLLGQSYTQQTEDPDRIYFPGQSGRRNDQIPVEPVKKSFLDNRMLSATLKIAERINDIESFDEFLEFIGAPREANISTFTNRFGVGKERSNAERPQSARCMPELTTVSLKVDNNPSKTIYPSCTRIKRCGGCCSHTLLSCQPIASEIRNFEVITYELDKDLQANYNGKEIVALEEHTECKCGCRIKEEHCNHKQVYEQDICQCVCTNIDEEEKCKSNSAKLWDVDNCTCLCREIHDCSTSYYFDQNTCSCKKIPLRIQDFSRRTGYKFGQTQRPESIPPLIVTLDASDPRRKPKDDPEY